MLPITDKKPPQPGAAGASFGFGARGSGGEGAFERLLRRHLPSGVVVECLLRRHLPSGVVVERLLRRHLPLGIVVERLLAGDGLIHAFNEEARRADF